MRLRSQKLSEVPPDVWRTIARATLAAEGDGLAAWARLSTVSRAWREHLAGGFDSEGMHQDKSNVC